MKKILNKKTVLIILLIVIIIIGGSILYGIFISKIFPFLGTMRESTLPYEFSGNESIKQFLVTSDTQSENIQTSNYDSGLKLVRKGNVNIEIEKGKFYETLNKLISIAGQFNGNLINSQIYEEDEKNSGNLIFMIPSKNFNDFLNKLNELGKVKNLSMTTQDVSEEYFDLEGRLKILESQRTLLLSWLEKAKEIKDLLSIRTELQNIETEIERVKGRLNYINYHSEYSEISILLNEKSETPPIWKKSEILTKIIEGLTFALKSIVNSIVFLIIFIALILPWALFAYFIYFLFKKYFIKKSENK